MTDRREEPVCRCGHERSAHALRKRRIDGRYCKLCPCTGYEEEAEG